MNSLSVLKPKLEELKSTSFTELAGLPEAQESDIVVDGEKCCLVVFREMLDDKSIRIIVELATYNWRGKLIHGDFEAFIKYEDGSSRDLTEDEYQRL